MHITEFDIYKDLLKQKSGLVITPDKSYLLESRLGPVAKKWGYADLSSLTKALQGVADKELVNDVIEAMTTNETSFFRDTRPFDMFRDVVMPYMMQKRASSRRLRIWCAAASSGQEPYSLCMILKEMGAKLSGWNIEIVGTDISNDILDQARAGIYSQFEVQRGMPIQMLMSYFTQDADKWKIKDDIKKMVQYKYFNLLDSMTALGKFDVVFCRNVLIYFDEKTKGEVLGRMAKQMVEDSFLFLGGAETVLGITDAFKPVPDRRGLYALDGSSHLAPPAAAAYPTGSPPLASGSVSA